MNRSWKCVYVEGGKSTTTHTHTPTRPANDNETAQRDDQSTDYQRSVPTGRRRPRLASFQECLWKIDNREKLPTGQVERTVFPLELLFCFFCLRNFAKLSNVYLNNKTNNQLTGQLNTFRFHASSPLCSKHKS
ncbi:hypothetical protein T08_15476 [Trichinella sp. T8]|nr:hypothetical protein T08_15476 [Trichinella sp. T8]